jgi:hypothetical protein
LKEFFSGSIKQHQERCARLMERIPRNLPREFHALAQKCRDELQQLHDNLGMLLKDTRMQLPNYQPERLRQFRRIVEYMNILETTAIAALARHNDDDLFLNRLIEHIRSETNFPLLPPIVTSLSQQYFHIYPNLNLLFVPLSEGDFLLHLPDLYHELAHPLVTERYDRRVRPIQAAFSQTLDTVLEYIANEQQKEERRRGPQRIGFYLYLWQKSWLEWTTEFYCDLYAICTIGPAFAWSHIYLCAKYGNDPFEVPTMSRQSHPADDARMKTMLCGLRLLGYTQEADVIQTKWEELINISGAKPGPEYRRCFPQQMLQQIAEMAIQGVDDIGCKVASPKCTTTIYAALNEAWSQFWVDPMNYITWERQAVESLRSLP